MVFLVQKAAIYCRVSTYDQSCERQERDLLTFAAKSGYEVVGIWKETASGVRTDRTERKKIMALVQRRDIDVIFITELSRWGRSNQDLIDTLHRLEARKVSLIALSGGEFDLSTPQGKMFASMLAVLAEFERDLIRERVMSGLANAKAKGKRLGRPKGHQQSDKYASRVLKLVEEKRPYRLIAKDLGISKTTVVDIIKRHRPECPLVKT